MEKQLVLALRSGIHDTVFLLLDRRSRDMSTAASDTKRVSPHQWASSHGQVNTQPVRGKVSIRSAWIHCSANSAKQHRCPSECLGCCLQAPLGKNVTSRPFLYLTMRMCSVVSQMLLSQRRAVALLVVKHGWAAEQPAGIPWEPPGTAPPAESALWSRQSGGCYQYQKCYFNMARCLCLAVIVSREDKESLSLIGCRSGEHFLLCIQIRRKTHTCRTERALAKQFQQSDLKRWRLLPVPSCIYTALYLQSTSSYYAVLPGLVVPVQTS